jgi:hypothetical protein
MGEQMLWRKAMWGLEMALTRKSAMALPSGKDTLHVRQAYFRERRRHLGNHRTITGWVMLSVAIVGWLFMAGFTGLGPVAAT